MKEMALTVFGQVFAAALCGYVFCAFRRPDIFRVIEMPLLVILTGALLFVVGMCTSVLIFVPEFTEAARKVAPAAADAITAIVNGWRDWLIAGCILLPLVTVVVISTSLIRMRVLKARQKAGRIAAHLGTNQREQRDSA